MMFANEAQTMLGPAGLADALWGVSWATVVVNFTCVVVLI